MTEHVLRPRLHPTRLQSGSRRAQAAALLSRPEGASVPDLLAAFGLSQDSPMSAVYSRLYALTTALQLPIRKVGQGRSARYFLSQTP